jgi:multicomponent Na+:H+ antiporter subunit A
LRTMVLVPVALLCLGLGGLPFTGGAIAKYAVKAQLDVGIVGWLAALSAAGTTLLMLQFLRRLSLVGADQPRAIAPLGLLWPWLLMSVAALVLPWILHPLLGLDETVAAIAPKALWSTLWPVALGGGLAVLLRRWLEELPRVPEGDIAGLIDRGARVAVGWGGGFDRFDKIIREWPAATVALLVVGVALGAALLTT